MTQRGIITYRNLENTNTHAEKVHLKGKKNNDCPTQNCLLVDLTFSQSQICFQKKK